MSCGNLLYSWIVKIEDLKKGWVEKTKKSIFECLCHPICRRYAAVVWKWKFDILTSPRYLKLHFLKSFKPRPLLPPSYTHKSLLIQRFYNEWCQVKISSTLKEKTWSYIFSKFHVLPNWHPFSLNCVDKTKTVNNKDLKLYKSIIKM